MNAAARELLDSVARRSHTVINGIMPDPLSISTERLPLVREAEAAEPYPIEQISESCPLLGSAARDVAAAAQAHPAVAGAAVLTAAALLAQTRFDVVVSGRRYPLSLFAVTVALSGERKSECDNLALATVVAFERTELARHKANPEQTRNPRMLDSDPTIEGIARSFENGSPSRLIACADGGLFVGGHGFSRDQALKTAAGLTLLWDGKPITRTRSTTRESSTYYGRRVSLHLQGQPSAMGAFVGNPMLKGQGLLARCLLAVPPRLSGRKYEAIDANTLPGLAAFRCWQTSMLEQRVPLRIYNDQETDELDPVALHLDPDAESMFAGAYDTSQRAIEPGGSMEPCREFGARIHEHIARIAGIFAVVNGSRSVGTREIRGAMELVEWHASEWIRAVDSAEMTEDTRRAIELSAWLSGRDSPVVALRDIYRNGPRFVRSVSMARRLMAILAEHDHVVEIGGGSFLRTGA